MLTVSRFITSKEQSEFVQLSKPEVPEFWGGYYAIYKPENGSLWVKRWHSKDSGKTIKNAYKVLPVKEAHQKWNDFLNHKATN